MQAAELLVSIPTRQVLQALLRDLPALLEVEHCQRAQRGQRLQPIVHQAAPAGGQGPPSTYIKALWFAVRGGWAT